VANPRYCFRSSSFFPFNSWYYPCRNAGGSGGCSGVGGGGCVGGGCGGGSGGGGRQWL